MTEYVLDVEKWKTATRGEGKNNMLNEQGYMCCLGQFAKQMGVDDKDLIDKTTPYRVFEKTKTVYDPSFLKTYKQGYVWKTPLSSSLIAINDDFHIKSDLERVCKIKAKLESKGHTLKILNEHLL